jgi:DNA-directed RNA polymerase specialized sigma subunit
MTRRSIALSTEQQSIIKHPDIINLVGALARKTTQLLKRPPSEEEELRNVGLSTLPEIVLRFDKARGVTFTTFAYRRIRGAMIDHIRKSSGYSRSEKKSGYARFHLGEPCCRKTLLQRHQGTGKPA